MADVTLANVTKSFGDVAVIKGVDLSIGDGEFCVFVGPSGCGKSTLLRLVAGLEDITSGELRIGGRDVTRVEPASRGVAMVFQSYALYPHMSVRDNISLSSLAKLQSALGLIDAKKESALVQGYIESLGIKTPSAETRVENLSGGNQQKVVVAKLAATEPRVLFLDEPTQGVDVQAKVEILRIVDDLSKRGVTVGVVSDELSELIDICDRIFVFYRGRIVREFRKADGEITSVEVLAAIEGESAGAIP